MLRFKDYTDYADELHSGHYRDGALRVRTLVCIIRRLASPRKNTVGNAVKRACLLLATLLAPAAGCQLTYPRPYSTIPGARWNTAPDTPRELQKVTLPDYIIEPPDILTIDAVTLVPHPPYHLHPLDIVKVTASGLPDQGFSGDLTVGIDGTLVLGFGYDKENNAYQPLKVDGMTLPEVHDAIKKRLELTANEADVSVSLVKIATQQTIAGEHLVGPDGTVNLGAYGRVRVVGKTLEQAKAAIEEHLATRFDRPEVAIDVFGYNSKVYYVVIQGAGLGDQIFQLPVKGNETVLDALSQVQGLSGSQSTRMWVARPGSNECGGDQIMPVDWLGITQRGDIATNYQILPGDRMYISEDKLVALDTALAKAISPFERIFSVTLLGTQASKGIRFFNNPNANNNF
jgi:polysaccharide export outer membrane protein